MFDLLFNPQKAERHPLEIGIIAVFYSSLSIVLGMWIFNTSAVASSLAIVFLTTISCLYMVQGALKMEEKKEKNYNSEGWVLKQHKPLVMLILSLFLGFTLSFAMWSFILPPEAATKVFSLQASSVEQIQAITGNALSLHEPLGIILTNNLNIVLISLVFAFFFGAGAIYILVWNASIMGLVIGVASRESIGLLALPVAVTKYFLHGIPEMIAYIIAAVAGGILYFALIKGDLTRKDRVKRILLDVAALVLIAVAILIVSAFIEVYISTLL